ncbi:MAG: hypothetical protein EXS05_04640 [Planctomycetaceae bacterium]|nr:hypothetical protein [Planctomycetaceae bacterium]
MKRNVMDEPISARLKELRDTAELCDSSGKMLGYFTPACDDDEFIRTEPPISDKEWERRMVEPASTTAEVLARLLRIKCPL